MPIKIPNDLPARAILEREGVRIISETDAIRQDVRPLRIALLAVRLALAAFLVPFAFVFDPALLLKGSVLATATATLCVAIGLTLIVFALEGFVRKPLSLGVRLLCLIGGFGFLFVRPLSVALFS